jgi:plasmid maintenance system antidote protein VapI
MYGKTPINAKKIIQLTLNDIFIKEWETIQEAAECLGLQSSNISNVCKGKRKTCGGFHWKYK